MKEQLAIYFGEFLGTFIVVFFGTATVAVSVLFNAPAGLVQVAAVWGVGVTLAIYATRHLSCAHLNPAVSLGMVLAGRMQPRLLLPYWGAQLAGATLAGGVVLLIFQGPIAGFEAAHAIFAGWREIAIPGPRGGFFWVYIAAPLIGGAGAALWFRWGIAPLMAAKDTAMRCSCGPAVDLLDKPNASINAG